MRVCPEEEEEVRRRMSKGPAGILHRSTEDEALHLNSFLGGNTAGPTPKIVSELFLDFK